MHFCCSTFWWPLSVGAWGRQLSVPFLYWYGDHSEAGKIWENQIFTTKMGSHGPENNQIDEGTCQGPRGVFQNFFSVHYPQQPLFQRSSSNLQQGVLNSHGFVPFSWFHIFHWFVSIFLHHLLYDAQLLKARQECSFSSRNATVLWLLLVQLKERERHSLAWRETVCCTFVWSKKFVNE